MDIWSRILFSLFRLEYIPRVFGAAVILASYNVKYTHGFVTATFTWMKNNDF